MMKKQENLTTEIFRSAIKKNRMLAMALLVSLIANLAMAVVAFIKK